jgi:hypothetical protein
MVLQTTRNLNEYHSVFADSLIAIINKLATNETDARKIMLFNIRQSYILYRMDTPSQRAQLDQKLVNELALIERKASKHKGVINFDHILKEELDEMELEKRTTEELQIKMFTFMTLAGIKPVQNTQQRAGGYMKFAGIPEQ